MAMETKRVWKLQEFVAHASSVGCLALGHMSGRVLVTGGDDKKVNLWAVGKPNCIMSLGGHTTGVECVRFGHTEELVCAGSQAGAIKIWDLEAAKMVRTLTGHRGAIRCLDFHPYGDFLCSGSLDTNLKLWDIRRKGCIFTYKGHSEGVNGLRFSPDGQWVASAGEEGAVKLWDLRAGRLLRELRGHQGAVWAVEFHPHEFLLASGGWDRKVLFWDLESFQLVSGGEGGEAQAGGGGGPAVRCLAFTPGGQALLSGAADGLRMVGWEPWRTLAQLPVGWGRLQDMAAAHQTQLIAASCHGSTVALYVVDLSRLHHLSSAAAVPGPSSATAAGPDFKHGHPARRSFVRDKPSNGARAAVRMKAAPEESDRSGTDPEDDGTSFADDIQHVRDFRAIFHPSRDLARTPPPSEEPFPAPPEDDPLVPQIMASPMGEGVAGTAPPPPPPPPVVVVMRAPSSPPPPASRASCKSPGLARRSLGGPPAPQVAPPTTCHSLPDGHQGGLLRHSPSEPQLHRLDSPHPRSSSLTRTPAAGNAAPQHRPPSPPPSVPLLRLAHDAPPPAEKPERVDYVPMLQDKPAGLDMHEFLPKRLQAGMGLGMEMGEGCLLQQTCAEAPPMSEAEVFSSILRGHDSILAILVHRQRSLHLIHNLWTTKDAKTAVESAVSMSDAAVLVDLLGVLVLRPSVWNLDLCVAVLPSVHHLLQSKYEIYMSAGLNVLRLILRNFSSVIRSNIQSPIRTLGVDISREERYNKCVKCYNQLVSIRAFVLKRQTLQGKLGHTFRELHILLQTLDTP